MKTSNLFDEVNASLQVHAEVDEGPDDSFSLVFLLLNDEHVMVEELLKLLVGEVDAELLEAVELKRRNGSFKRFILGLTQLRQVYKPDLEGCSIKGLS